MLPARFTRPGQQHLPLRIGKHYGIATRPRHTASVARGRSHGGFACVDGYLPDGTTLALFRLRYRGSANRRGFCGSLGQP
jgi:hypothetical protein